MGNCCSKKKKSSVIQALTIVDNNTSSASNAQGSKKEDIQAKSKQINNEVTKAERKRSENPKETNKSSINVIVDNVITKFTLDEFTYKRNEKDMLKNEILKKYKQMTNLHELRNFPYIEENELNIKTLDLLKEMYYQIYYSDIFLKNYNNGFYNEDNANFNKIKESESINDMYLTIKYVINENNQVFLDKLKQNDKNEKSYDDIISVKDKIINLAGDYQIINSIRVENEDVKRHLDKKDALLNGLNKEDSLTVQIKIKRLITHMEEEEKKSKHVRTVTSFPSSSKKKKTVDLSESENEDDIRNTYGELF